MSNYLVKNIDNPNWKSYKYMIVRDCNDEKAPNDGFWFWSVTNDLVLASREIKDLASGLIVEVSQVVPVDWNGKPIEEKVVEIEDPIMAMITFNALHKRPKEWRFGQAVFNFAYKAFPSATEQLRGTKVDPFYNDTRVGAFLNELLKLVK